ncbi:MAG: hypothetical protein DRO12_06290 [Thermoprotei archaeon]|nr:MAG: hypothetical protein DRO12_06290 [Thermoprotei archaeon]
MIRIEDFKTLYGAGKMLGAIGNIIALAYALKEAATMFEMIEVENELKKIMGKEWVEECRKDWDCKLKLIEIAEESLEIKARTPEEERKEREEYRRKIFEELRQKLEEIGVSFYCEEKDLGELGTLYEDCYIEYKGETFSITEDIGV